jgi:hypothetical protein
MASATAARPVSEYRDAMLCAAALAWEERWEAAVTAYRRALAAKPGDSTAERHLDLALSRVEGAPPSPEPDFSPPLVAVTPSDSRFSASAHPERTNEIAFGRTASGHVAELADLPRGLVRTMVEGMHAIEHEQANGHYSAAFERAYALLQLAPTFLPLHILLADLYTDTGQWEAVRAKLETLDATYAARGVADARKAAA